MAVRICIPENVQPYYTELGIIIINHFRKKHGIPTKPEHDEDEHVWYDNRVREVNYRLVKSGVVFHETLSHSQIEEILKQE
jgi:hypothetical protein